MSIALNYQCVNHKFNRFQIFEYMRRQRLKNVPLRKKGQ